MAEGHPRRVAAVIAGGLCALIATGTAQARPPVSLVPNTVPAQAPSGAPPLVVVVIPQNAQVEEAAARLNYVARQAATRSGRFGPVRLSDALDQENAKARQERATEAAASLQAARAAYDELDTEKALAAADRALRAWSETDLTLNIGELSQAWLFKIASLVANGETKLARAEIDRLIAVNPDAQLSTNFFPPDDIAYAEKARLAAEEAKGALEIRTTPAGAEVYVNGRFHGISPLTVKGLGEAEHYVTALKAGFSLAQQRAKPGPVDLVLRPAEAQTRYEALARSVNRDPDGAGRDAAAREFGTWLGVEQVLLIHVGPPKAGTAQVTGLRLDPKDGHNFAYARQDLPLGEDLLQKGDAFVTALLAQDAARKGGPSTHFAAKGGGFERKTAGYALLAVGGAGMAAGLFSGIGALVLQDRAYEQAEASPRNAAALSTARTGRNYAIVADVSWLIGLAAAGGGAYLAFAGGDGAGPAAKPADKPRAVPSSSDPADQRRREEEERKRKQQEDEERKKKRREEDDLRNY